MLFFSFFNGQESGYQNWKSNIDMLRNDKDTYLSCLPSDIISIINKICEQVNKTRLGSLGWFSVVPEQCVADQAIVFPYEIGAEKYFGMECLFNPSLIGNVSGEIFSVVDFLLERRIVECNSIYFQ